MSDIKVNGSVLHCHSEYSIRDASMTIKELVSTAKEYGAKAVALTDHGTLAGIIEFNKVCHEEGIKPIFGMEAYYNDGSMSKNQHLILMAKDHQGYRAICRALIDAYENMHKGEPCLTMDMLKKNFGKGKEGHNHVIATSACMLGMIASIILANDQIDAQLPKMRAKRDKYHPVDDTFLTQLELEESRAALIADLIQQRDALKEKASVSVVGLKRRLKTLDAGSEEYKNLEDEINQTLASKEKAAEELDAIKKKIASEKRAKTEYSKMLAPIKASVEKWAAEDEKIQELIKSAVPEETLKADATALARQLQDIFGAKNFYMEVQYHGISSEKKCMPILVDIAKELNIPLVAANDAHYAKNTPECIRARTIISALRFNNPIPDDVDKQEGYGELYIKTDDELFASLSKILPKEVVKEAITNTGKIADACNCEMPSGDHYPRFINDVEGESAEDRLRRLAVAGIPERYGSRWCKEYEDRMNYELDIINRMGYADYHCIVQDFLAFGRSLAKECPEGIGYTIGPGRGSAVGSIVCYLIGITSVDPMKYGLIFERFLNPERVSMPDIDSDFHTELRAKVVDYVKEKYGTHAVCNIMTKGTNAGKGAIRAVGRVTNIPDTVVEQVVKQVPTKPNAKIADIPNIEELYKNPLAKQLIEDAQLIEGLTVSYGMHAAGIIISDNDDVGDYVALSKNDDGNYVAQCDMGQAEKDAGLIKMDFLGLKNLDVITDTLGRIKHNTGESIDIEKVEIESEVLKGIFSSGRTNSVFQFESGGMKSMLRRFRPTSMEDLILLVAAYRPGPMQYLDHIIAVKHGKETPNYIAAGLKEILEPTYGYPIYQEQIMAIFNKVAGFSMGEADVVRRAMGKKKISILLDPTTNYRGRFIDGLKAAGASDEDAERFWNELLDFASYAFNKSHAAAYAHISYYTAWLKYHYPAEYMCSVMCRSDWKKIPGLLDDCRVLGLQVCPPDINNSVEGFANIGNKVIFGFNDVKGVGNAGAVIVADRAANGKYTSVKDVLIRIIHNGERSVSRAVYEALINSGAFDDFCSSRQSLLANLEPMLDLAGKVKKKEAGVVAAETALKELGKVPSEKELKKAQRLLENRKKAFKQTKEEFQSYIFITKDDDTDQKLAKEYECLGAYISGSPLDKYDDAIDAIKDRIKISDLESSGKATVCGMIKDFEIRVRKKDGMKFCTFVLSDKSGEIETKCFVKEYSEYADILQAGNVVSVEAKVVVDDFNKEVSGEEQFNLVVITAKKLTVCQKDKIAIMPTGLASCLLDSKTPLDDVLKAYEDPEGCEAIFFDSFHEACRLTFRVSINILSESEQKKLKESGLMAQKM